MKRTWQTALFLLPLAVVLGVPLLIMWLGGEFTSPDTVIRRQLASPQLILHGPAYTNSAMYVKVRVMEKRRPRVMALGNSRVMQFTEDSFLPEARFYNAGGSAVRIRHFRAFLENTPTEALPEILLIATDASFFNTGFDQVENDSMNVNWLMQQMNTYSNPATVFQTNWQTVWKDLGAGKIKFSRLASLEGWSSRVGLNALCNNAGSRNDGSYRYSMDQTDPFAPGHFDYQFSRTLGFVAEGRGRFVWGDRPSEPALREMDALLDFCSAHHVHLINFLPPHAHMVWKAMQAQGNRYAYITNLDPTLRPRFEAHGFELYDFSDLASVGAPDTECIDGYHPNERGGVRLIVAMLERGSRLNAVASLPELRARLGSPVSAATP